MMTVLVGVTFGQGPARSAREIEITSGWGGLGTPQKAVVKIMKSGANYSSDGHSIDASLVNAFVEALQAPAVPKPEMGDLGITAGWLIANRAMAERSLNRSWTEATPRQRALFSASFSNIRTMSQVASNLFTYTSFDDNPYASVKVVFENGSEITAKTHSYYVFMVPWNVSGKGPTFNATISRTLSALLPSKAPNKNRLIADGLTSKLAEALMEQIKPQWELRGVEDRAGDTLRALRTAYAVKTADINPYHDVAFGIRWSEKGPHETNLQATLHKATFPKNMDEHLVLRYDGKKVQGVEQFLKDGGKYESLVLSVPWLLKYLLQHPNERVTLEHVHQTSFSDHAMESFAEDMTARGRPDLIPIVQAQQSQIALLHAGFVYWLVFPDRHMVLWRFEGPRGFLNWSKSDFPAGRCGEYYQVNEGGCSGREISPEGELLPDREPNDIACVAAFQKTQSSSLPRPEALFPVTQNSQSGFIDQNGRIRIPLCFDAVGEFSEGLAAFERDALWGYIDEAGTVRIQPRFPWAEAFSEGLAKVQVTGSVLGYDGKWGFINQKGEVVIAPIYGWQTEQGGPEQAFHDGLAKVEVNGKSGYIDKTGEVVIQPQFSLAYPFSEGVAAVTKSESMESGWGYIDRGGKWIIPPRFDWATSFNEHLAAVNRKQDCGFIDLSGKLVLRPPVSPNEKDCASVWGDFSEGLARWKVGDKYGFINHAGEIVIQPAFNLVHQFSEGLAAVQIDGKWGYIARDGKITIEPRDLMGAEDFHKGLAQTVTRDGKWAYINKTGQHVWGPLKQNKD